MLAEDLFGDNFNLCTSYRCLHQVDRHLNNPDALHGDTSRDCKHALIIRSKCGSKGQGAHLKCLSNPEPDRQVKAGLSPSKDPRNGSQRINAGGCLTLGRSTSNVHASKLTYGSTLLEEINEACVFPHHIPVRIARYLQHRVTLCQKRVNKFTDVRLVRFVQLNSIAAVANSVQSKGVFAYMTAFIINNSVNQIRFLLTDESESMYSQLHFGTIAMHMTNIKHCKLTKAALL